MSIDLNNINAAFAKVENVSAEISAVSHSELVPLEYIVPSAYNPYNEFDGNNDNEAIKQLADSIAVQGLIEPIVLNKSSSEHYIILSGERRYKAISTLKWKTVPAQVYDNLNSDTANLILHTSNLEVREYTSGQKFIFYKDVKKILEKMKDKGKFNGAMQKAIANMLKINERQVRKYERICNELTESEQEEIINNNISINEAYKKAQSRKDKSTNSSKEKETDYDYSNNESTFNKEYTMPVIESAAPEEPKTSIIENINNHSSTNKVIYSLIDKTPDEINAMVDTGMFNSVITGYIKAVCDDLNMTSAISDYDFNCLFDTLTAEKARIYNDKF